jgi:ABC-type Fe3+-siderophore transport system permease subunit
MQTPVSNLATALFYWILFYVVSQVPTHSDNYYANLVFLTVIIPNAARYIVGERPELAVDRSFFAMSSLFALIIVFAVNEWWKRSKDTVKNFHKSDRRKHLELSGVLAGAFVIGALITYFSGIDDSIYNNMMQPNA